MDRYEEIADKYDFLKASYLVEIPKGWLNLVDQMCEELNPVIKEDGLDYGILQTKEKYGQLCWYDFGGNERTDEIIQKYEILYGKICCGCGKPATKISKSWICPWCDDCAFSYMEDIGTDDTRFFRDIEEIKNAKK